MFDVFFCFFFVGLSDHKFYSINLTGTMCCKYVRINYITYREPFQQVWMWGSCLVLWGGHEVGSQVRWY